MEFVLLFAIIHHNNRHTPLIPQFPAGYFPFPHEIRPSSLLLITPFQMGDTCCYPWSMGRITTLLEKAVPGVYVKSLMIGEDIEEDAVNGFFLNVNTQIDMVAKQLQADPKLANGFHAVGFSQVRAAAFDSPTFLTDFHHNRAPNSSVDTFNARYNNPPVLNYVSVGGQQQGVYGLPNCPGVNYTLCEYARELLDYGAYLSVIQENLVQAEYWNDPLDQEMFLASSVFLADINNAKATKNPQYKQRLLALKNMVLVRFSGDTVVQPQESEWFGFYAPGSDTNVLTLQQTPLYQEDWLGLQQLDKSGRLKFLESPGEHLKFTDAWFLSNVVGPYLNTTSVAY